MVDSVSLNEQFDMHNAWRRDFSKKLQDLMQWLNKHQLADESIETQLMALNQKISNHKITVAFVAEFSRGKSELINALFFANYGRRIMPASAGRTTMCPTELSYDASQVPSLRLLPIQTRLKPNSLTEWRSQTDEWLHIDLDTNHVESLVAGLTKVAEVIYVSKDEAKMLGFWHDDRSEDNPPVNVEGDVEIPRWRHALINLPHPLLEQGLVILDTPGLNAVGAEPELTISLIPQAHAVLFILGADTGVTRSDLAIWREYLMPESDDLAATRIVVLNKIDTLWDPLNTFEQIEMQIEHQRQSSAEMLGIHAGQVLAVSAQKALLAKISNNLPLLAASHLLDLEQVLSHGLIAQRSQILQQSVRKWVDVLHQDASRLLNMRRRDLTEQMLELKSLRGKNTAVIQAMRRRIEKEQDEFDQHYVQIQAIKTVHQKLQKQAQKALSNDNLTKILTQLSLALNQSGLKLGTRKIYFETFIELKQVLSRISVLSNELHSMLNASFKQLNAEHGFSLQVPPAPDLLEYESKLEQTQAIHEHHLNFSNSIKLTRTEYTGRLVRVLATQLRMIFESAANDLDVWNKSAMSQLSTQVLERRKGFAHRLGSIDRIQDAAANLADRIIDIESSGKTLLVLEQELEKIINQLITISQNKPDIQIRSDQDQLDLDSSSDQFDHLDPLEMEIDVSNGVDFEIDFDSSLTVNSNHSDSENKNQNISELPIKNNTIKNEENQNKTLSHLNQSHHSNSNKVVHLHDIGKLKNKNQNFNNQNFNNQSDYKINQETETQYNFQNHESSLPDSNSDQTYNQNTDFIHMNEQGNSVNSINYSGASIDFLIE